MVFGPQFLSLIIYNYLCSRHDFIPIACALATFDCNIWKFGRLLLKKHLEIWKVFLIE